MPAGVIRRRRRTLGSSLSGIEVAGGMAQGRVTDLASLETWCPTYWDGTTYEALGTAFHAAIYRWFGFTCLEGEVVNYGNDVSPPGQGFGGLCTKIAEAIPEIYRPASPQSIRLYIDQGNTDMIGGASMHYFWDATVQTNGDIDIIPHGSAPTLPGSTDDDWTAFILDGIKWPAADDPIASNEFDLSITYPGFVVPTLETPEWSPVADATPKFLQAGGRIWGEGKIRSNDDGDNVWIQDPDGNEAFFNGIRAPWLPARAEDGEPAFKKGVMLEDGTDGARHWTTNTNVVPGALGGYGDDRGRSVLNRSQRPGSPPAFSWPAAGDVLDLSLLAWRGGPEGATVPGDVSRGPGFQGVIRS